MKITVARLIEAGLMIKAIIESNRKMTQKGAYRLSRVWMKVQPELVLALDRRLAIIKECGGVEDKVIIKIEGQPDQENSSGSFTVPKDRHDEFFEKWNPISIEEIDLDVTPMPIDQFDLGDNDVAILSANELLALGDFVTDGN